MTTASTRDFDLAREFGLCIGVERMAPSVAALARNRWELLSADERQTYERMYANQKCLNDDMVDAAICTGCMYSKSNLLSVRIEAMPQ